MAKRKIPEILTEYEQEQLINVFNTRYFNSFRNRTMIKIFLASGLRLSELINLKWKDVPMMCFNEIDVPNSLRMCLRVLIVINCSENFEPEFVYLGGAEGLRK